MKKILAFLVAAALAFNAFGQATVTTTPAANPAAGAVAMGAPISGGTSGSVLFVNPSLAIGQDNASFNYTNTSSQPLLQVGSGASTGIKIGFTGASGFGGIWHSGAANPGVTNSALFTDGTDVGLNAPSASGQIFLRINNNSKGSIPATAGAGWNIVAGTATTDVNALNITQTWNQAATNFTGVRVAITDTSSGGSAKALQVFAGATAATSLLSLDKSGNLQGNGNIVAGSGSGLSWANRSQMTSPSDGVIRLADNAGTSFARANFGGDTSAFPALKRNGAAIQVRLADDSAVANLDASVLSGNTLTVTGANDAANIGVSAGSTTGSGTTSFISLAHTWNTTGVVPGAVKINITNTASGAGSRVLEAQRGGTLQFGVTSGATSTGTQIRTAQQTVPTVTTNGGTSPACIGSDSAMTCTEGTSPPAAATFTVTFNGTWATAPACVAVRGTAGATPLVQSVVTTTTTVQVNLSANLVASEKYQIICMGTS